MADVLSEQQASQMRADLVSVVTKMEAKGEQIANVVRYLEGKVGVVWKGSYVKKIPATIFLQFAIAAKNCCGACVAARRRASSEVEEARETEFGCRTRAASSSPQSLASNHGFASQDQGLQLSWHCGTHRPSFGL